MQAVVPQLVSFPLRDLPEATLRRLPLYHRWLKQRLSAGDHAVSCPAIGAALGLDPTQVRKDLEATGAVGRPRVGYVLGDLLAHLEQFMGFDNAKDAFLVGAGSLGSALLGYMKFESQGLNIVAAFDEDPAKIGTRVRGKHVLPMEKLSELAERMHVHIGIITVPEEFAQAVADRLVAAGILGIWNFAPVRLSVPANVIVHNEDLYVSLATLSQKLEVVLRRDALLQRGAQQGLAEYGIQQPDNPTE